jgi:hypothetical protein
LNALRCFRISFHLLLHFTFKININDRNASGIRREQRGCHRLVFTRSHLTYTSPIKVSTYDIPSWNNVISVNQVGIIAKIFCWWHKTVFLHFLPAHEVLILLPCTTSTLRQLLVTRSFMAKLIQDFVCKISHQCSLAAINFVMNRCFIVTFHNCIW